MKNLRAYYSKDLVEFLKESDNSIYGEINSNATNADVTIEQQNAWKQEIAILKKQLSGLAEGRILFEYTIPRMGKRVDVVLLHNNLVFLLEFKCGDSEYRSSTYDQVYDYALDLRNFQKESHDKLLVPIQIPTLAPAETNTIKLVDRIVEPLNANQYNIGTIIEDVSNQFSEPDFDYEAWENGTYLPTPTIVEAAQALYRGHGVEDITRNDADAKNLSVTTAKIDEIIDYSKANHRKSICFVTGVPGAGKTLVGLNLAIEKQNAQAGEHAVFLSGNFPLVDVLQEALARDKVAQAKAKGQKISKADALRSTSEFIQIIHRYRDSFVGNDDVPPEHVVIFDEAQRAWTKKDIASFMSRKKGVPDFQYSEPEFLIQTMDRQTDWGVVVCLVGGGQEINHGEAGLLEWFDSLRRSFKHWDVYVTPQLDDTEYRRDRTWQELIADLNVYTSGDLHLSTSVRSFRTPDLAAFVKALLDVDVNTAKALFNKIKDKYPIRLTRDLSVAKKWIKGQCQGTTRYGMIASSEALRLKPCGIFVKNTISVPDWFLDGKDDVRSSYFLEDVVTQFDIQGLEIDYTLVGWDADLRFNGTDWEYYNFTGNRWCKVGTEDNRLYLKNTYRVLLTRARQGMIIFIPYGDLEDETRKPEFYDKTFDYLKSLGIEEI